MAKCNRFGVTRRDVLAQSTGAGLAVLGAGTGIFSPISKAQAAPPYEAYHGATGAQHQANFTRLSAAKFRIVSLSVYGDPPNVQYAAVWVNQPGGAAAAVHGLNAHDYQAAVDSWRGKGFAPTIVSATGPADRAIYAAVFEPASGAWKARHGMSDADFTNEVMAAGNGKQILRWVSAYGSSTDRRYIATWHANPGFAKWHAFGNVAPGDYQRLFDAQTSLPQFRPACIAITPDQHICALFTDEAIGPWSARHGMTTAEYQAEFNRQRAAGRMPVCVQGGGSGNGTRYAAIFAGQPVALQRTWTAVGPAASNLSRVDTLVRNFMSKNAVRALQVTIAQNGSVKLQRAYTWAEPGYHRTAVTDRFLLASNSKMFVAAAVQRLYDQRKLQQTTQAYPLLGFNKPKDARSDTITVQQLLDHTAGFGKGYDPSYDMRTIANSRGVAGPVGKRDIASYMYARDLDYAPGSAPGGSVYSNYGYLLASLVVEQASGQDYWQFVRTQVLQPDGITEVDVYPTAASSRPANLVAAEDDALGKSALAPKSDADVPAVFGGDGMVKETAAGSCGLAASATALTQFIQRHAAWGTGGRAVSAREGSTPGASSWAESRPGGTDWAMVMNTRAWAPDAGDAFHVLKDAINAELTRVGV